MTLNLDEFKNQLTDIHIPLGVLKTQIELYTNKYKNMDKSMRGRLKFKILKTILTKQQLHRYYQGIVKKRREMFIKNLTALSLSTETNKIFSSKDHALSNPNDKKQRSKEVEKLFIKYVKSETIPILVNTVKISQKIKNKVHPI